MSSDTLDDMRALEALYAAKPGAYRRKVLRLIATGYLYIFLAIGVIVALVVGGAVAFGSGTVSLLLLDNYIKLSLPLLIVAAIMARALFVRIPPPEGIVLSGDEKAQVTAFFEDVRKATGGLRIHDVVITDELNAAVQQLPKFGLIGPSKNYLILGLPLLELCTPEEVKAVIAHEFGHLSHRHGRIGAMVYRLNTTLVRAAQEVEQKSDKGTHARPYRALLWFHRKFNTLTFAMRRGQEYEADSVAARTTSARAIASALCRLHALDRPLAQHWNDVWERPRHNKSNAGELPFAGLRSSVAERFEAGPAEQAVDAALDIETGYSDSHPSLKDRLAALDTSPVSQFDFGQSAFDHMVDDSTRAAILRRVDERWQRASESNWVGAREHFEAMQAQISTLQAQRGSLDADGLFELARLIEDLDGPAAARDVFEQLARQNPDLSWVQYHWGRVNVDEHFEVAEPALLKAAELDLELVGKIVPMLRYGYAQAGEPEKIERFEPTLQRYGEMCEAADAERETIRTDDACEPVELSDEGRATLKAFFGDYDELRKVWLVKKCVQHFENTPVLVLAYDVNTWHNDVEVDEQKWGQRITDKAVRSFPWLERSFWLIVEKKSEWREVLDSVEDSVIHTGTGKSKKKKWWKSFTFIFLLISLLGVLILLLLGEPIA